MAVDLNTVRQGLRAFVGNLGGNEIKLAKVKAVDLPNKQCTVALAEDENIVLEKVMLSVFTEGEAAEVVEPKADSFVLICNVDGVSNWAVLKYSEAETITLMGGLLGGLVKVESLVTRLNAIEDKLNEVLNAVKSHTHSPVPANGTAPPSTELAGLTTIVKTQKTDIENDKIKQ